MKSSRVFVLGAVASALVVPVQPVLAQGIEEIVVTARKREESLQEVPLSISAFSEEFIDDTGVNSITDVAQYTPNLSFRRSFGRAFDRPAIRGQGPILGAQTVGLFVDGVFIAGTLSSTPLDNIERIEVVKGPQAAMFGRATLAGAINYVTKKPGNEWEGKLTARLAEHEEYEIRTFVSGPIIEDTLAFNLGLRHYEYGGEYDNIGPGGTTLGQEDTDSVYGTLLWTPTDNFSAELSLTWFEDEDGHPVNDLAIDSPELNCFLPNFRGYFCGTVPNRGALDLEIDPTLDYGIERETFRSSLKLEYDWNDYTVTAVTATAKEDEDWLVDFGWETNEFFLWQGRTTTINEELEYNSTELRISSPGEGAFRWLAGFYFYDEESLDPVAIVSSEVENQALFAQVEFDFNDRWSLGLEARWAEDEITEFNSAGIELNDTFDSFTPRATLTWQQDDNGNIYFTMAKGTKPGDFNGGVFGADVPAAEQARLAPLLIVDEEEAWNYELGLKRTVMDGRVDLTAAVFYIDWSEQQLTSSEPFIDINGVPDTLAIIRNIGETEVTGMELGVFANVTDNLNMSLTWGWSDAEIKKNCDSEWGAFRGPDTLRCDQTTFPGAADTAGNRTPNAPEHTASLRANYTRPLANGVEWFIGGDFNYESTRYAQVFNLAETGDSKVVNLRTGFGGERWRATLWGKNLTDDDSVDSIIRFIDFDTLFFGLRRAFQAGYPRGRQVGINFDYRFGGDGRPAN